MRSGIRNVRAGSTKGVRLVHSLCCLLFVSCRFTMSWNALSLLSFAVKQRAVVVPPGARWSVRSPSSPLPLSRPIWRVRPHVTLPYRSNKATLPPIRYSRTEEALSPQRIMRHLTLISLQLHHTRSAALRMRNSLELVLSIARLDCAASLT